MLLPLAIIVSGPIGLLLVIALVGVVAWLLVTYVPMPPPMKTVLIVVAVLIVILMAWDYFGGIQLSR